MKNETTNVFQEFRNGCHGNRKLCECALLCYNWALHESFKDRLVTTVSFNDCSAWEQDSRIPVMKVTKDVDAQIFEERYKHFTGDWNSVNFFQRMAINNKNQCNVMVFQHVWWRALDKEDRKKSEESKTKHVLQMYENTFRKEFFDNFFPFVAKTRYVKENGLIVLPFHPRVIAGMHRVAKDLSFLKMRNNIAAINDVEKGWRWEVQNRNYYCGDGYDHNILSEERFMKELKTQSTKMGTNPELTSNFMSGKKHTLKWISIAPQ